MNDPYTSEQMDTVLDLYFRDAPRPMPFPLMASRLGLPEFAGLSELVWKLVTGYAGTDPNGPRREYAPGPGRVDRAGVAWYPREDAALAGALAGEGQQRQPPCDAEYIAAVLNRPVGEVVARWRLLRDHGLRRTGFGLKV